MTLAPDLRKALRRWTRAAAATAATLFVTLIGPVQAATGAPARAPQEAVDVEAPKPVTQQDIDLAIEKAISFLLARQELDGSWRPDELKYVSGQTGQCVYTLLKAGLEKDHPAIQRGIAYLQTNPPQFTYGIACCLLAVEAADPVKYAPEIEAWTATLLEAHGSGFGYPGTPRFPNTVEDLSLTQYGALGLRVAEAAGLKVHHTIWESLIDYAMLLHNDDGSFSYRLGTPHTGSMTAAGIAVLHIAREALDAQNRIGARERRQIQETIDDARDWLGEHLRMDRNPDPYSEDENAGHMRRWALYYLYGLERVGGLTGIRTFGPHDWYQQASTYLVRSQGNEGQWSNGGGEPHPGTCFGVLVLKRATAPTSGTKPRGSRSYGGDDPKSPLSLRVTGDTPLTAWVSSFGKKTLRKFEWDEDVGKGPRILRVDYFDDTTQEVFATIDGDGDKPADADRFAARFKMSRPGTFRLRARAYVRPIDDEDGEEVALLSQVVEVAVDATETEAMRRAREDLGLNALRNTVCEVRASSFATDGQKPEYAVDGHTCYSWLSKPDDADRWIEVEPERPQRGDHIVLTPALAQPDQRNRWGRPSKVFIRVNNKKVGEFTLDDDPFAKTYIPLKKKTVVRLVRVEILETAKGNGGHGAASGFAEVEVQLRPELLKAWKARKRAQEKSQQK